MRQMDYMREINSFERWLETNYLPCLSQLLWYRLMALCNRAGWPEWVAVDNWRLMGMIQCKREATLIDVRDKLIDRGLVEFKRGKKGSPNKYKICTFTCEVQNVVNTVAENVVNTAANTVDISSYPADTNKTKTKTKTNRADAPSRAQEAAPDALASLDPEVREAFGEFLKARAKLKKPMTAKATALSVRKLRELAGDDPARQIQHIEQSIEHGWLTFYPIGQKSQGPPWRKVTAQQYTQRDYTREELQGLVENI